MLHALSNEIGMTVQYAKQPKQNEILRVTKETIPHVWGMKGNPSIHMDRASVSVKLTDEPTEAEIADVRKKIMQATGYQLECK